MNKIELINQGKVCDIYQNENFSDLMFFHRTNRFSVGDRVFPGEILYKGLILNEMSLKWMEFLEQEEIVRNHIITSDAKTLLSYGVNPEWAGCVVAAKKCIPIPIECIVRGYYIPESKSWDPYKETGMLYGNKLPKGLKESQILPSPIYTPSTKAGAGEHDENINFDTSVEIIKDFLLKHFELEEGTNINVLAYTIADNIRNVSLRAYRAVHERAIKKGIILADTKLEFGILQDVCDWHIVLIDECFTPDSSRYWDGSTYEVGKPQPSMDKQFLRRHVYTALKWDGESSPPIVQESIRNAVSEIYSDIYQRLFDESVVKLSTDIAWRWSKAEKELMAG